LVTAESPNGVAPEKTAELLGRVKKPIAVVLNGVSPSGTVKRHPEPVQPVDQLRKRVEQVALDHEALNLLFEKYGKPPTA
jgi:hypothetical protein